MKKTLTTLAILFVAGVSFSQQIGNGLAPGISDYTIPLTSGVYSGLNATGGIPDLTHNWSHLFAIRHANSNNNNQLQISSSYVENDRLFFRKIAGTDVSPRNPAWFELATRGANTFAGNQFINGLVKIQTANGDYNENLRLLPSTTGDYSSIALGAVSGDSGTGIGQWTIVRYPAISNYMFSLRYNTTDYFNILNNGNVGIGEVNPKNKLDVNGTIHSKEVKVDMLGWSDFVFKKEYALPTLAEVEKHIKEKGHLENIPNEEEVLKNGINLGEMNAKLLQKIEELTLYMIEMKKENDQMKTDNLEMKKRLINLENK
ncbi:hypothetical protein [Flavobacterium sp. T12S277]|uniref:hypothetical protein n=1 Tax=Flavobacterium sp. T12S277 TaxID=3402752 RepID=UPI003ADFBA9D